MFRSMSRGRLNIHSLKGPSSSLIKELSKISNVAINEENFQWTLTEDDKIENWKDN